MPYFAHFLPCLIPSLKTLLLSLISLSPPSFLFLYHGGIFIVTNVYFYPLYLSLAFSVSLLFPLILFPFPHSPVLLCFFFNVTLGFIKIAYRALGGDVQRSKGYLSFPLPLKEVFLTPPTTVKYCRSLGMGVPH